MSNGEVLEQLANSVEGLDPSKAKRLVQEALAAGLSPSEILTEGLSQGMRRVGVKFNSGEMYMPEVLVACDVYFAGLGIVRPLMAGDSDQHIIGKMVLGNIHGDIHTVGKQVAMPVFEANGIQVIDIGEDASDEAFVEAIRQHQPRIVGFGTYMTSTFMHAKETVATIAKAGLRPQVRIICGGPAVDAKAARRMGADDAVDDAWKGVESIKQLLATFKT